MRQKALLSLWRERHGEAATRSTAPEVDMRRLVQWHASASWARRFVYYAGVGGVLFGAFRGLQDGWRAGLLAGALFGLLAGMISTVRSVRQFRRQRSQVGLEPREMVELGLKIMDGAPPKSATEAAALARLVAYRRKLNRRARWTVTVSVLPLVAFGVLGLGIGDVVIGTLLLAFSGTLLVVVFLSHPRESARLDAMDALLNSFPGDTTTRPHG
ncbi:MAG: hypothetical protein ACRDV2_02510 [Actinomycetes bacterium]